MDEFVLKRVTNIRELLQTDVVRAKQELGNHVGELIMRPQPDTGSYVVDRPGSSGSWESSRPVFGRAKRGNMRNG